MASHNKFKKANHFHTFFIIETFQYQVEVLTPDLSSSAEHCWGDWGPMYTLTLGEEQYVQVTYRSASRGLEASYKFKPSQIELNSPMFASDREKFPFYLEFEDEQRGLRFLAFFDSEAQVRHTEVETIHPELSVDELIFGKGSSQKLSA